MYGFIEQIEVRVCNSVTLAHAGGRLTGRQHLSCRVPSWIATGSRNPPVLPAGGQIRSVQWNQTWMPPSCSMIPEHQLA